MSDKTNTQVEQVTTADLDDLLGTPNAGSVMTGTEEPKKPSFFGKDKVDMSVLDDDTPIDPPADSDEPPADDTPPADDATGDDATADDKPADDVPPVSTDTIDDILDDVDNDDKSKPGRPKLDKEGMAQLAQELIKDKVILPFADEKPLEDYTLEDYKELFAMNFAEKEKAIREQTPKEFFEALPEELQYAAQYVANGGTDMKSLFKALAVAEESKAIDTSSERGQETVVREYLRATNFGSDDEIQEEIDSWKDLEKLEAKANQFKPKLDKMREQVLQRQLKEQEVKKKQQQDQSLKYAESVYNTLAKGELNGLKLNNKTQNLLYQGLIQPNYASVSGQNTNLFGHLIEKHQFIEPNHGLIAEALWLLADPEGYRAEIQKGAKNEQAAETARQLKIEQASKNSASGAEGDVGKTGNTKKGIQRPNKDFFRR